MGKMPRMIHIINEALFGEREQTVCKSSGCGTKGNFFVHHAYNYG